LCAGLVIVILCTLISCVCCGDCIFGCMAGLALALLPCITFPICCACICSACNGYSCEICGKGFSMFRWIYCGVSHSHRKSCLAKHRTEYNAIPSSSLYTCSTCQKPLKLWPSSRLEETRCTYCEVQIINDDTNLHVCFPCAGKGPYNQNHLCNRHGLTQGGLTRVNWPDKENFFQPEDEGPAVSGEENNHQENRNEEKSEVGIDPPGYEEATRYPTVSPWDDHTKNKTSQMIRQYSTGLKRMISSPSYDDSEDQEAQRMMAYPRQPPTNPHI